MAKKGYKQPTRIVRLRVNIENAIHEAETYSNCSREELCKALDMSRSTLWSRLKNPDSFTLSELRILSLLSGREYADFLSDIVK